MFHAHIDEDFRIIILSEFSRQSGCMRLVLTTIAFRLGIHVENVRIVVY